MFWGNEIRKNPDISHLRLLRRTSCWQPCSTLKNLENNIEDDQIEIEYWHHHQTNSYQLLKDIQCYLWCSVTGQEPIIPKREVVLPTEMPTKTIYDGLGISPHFVYTFNESHAFSGKKECLVHKFLMDLWVDFAYKVRSQLQHKNCWL